MPITLRLSAPAARHPGITTIETAGFAAVGGLVAIRILLLHNFRDALKQ